MVDLNQHKLELDYPCQWKYKVVTRCESDIDCIIKEILDEREHNLSASKQSSKGKFNSHNLELTVHSDEDRTDIYKMLGDHKDIKMVV